jgi:hypothetical protein
MRRVGRQDSVTVTMGDVNQSIVETVVAKLEFDVDSALVRKGMPRRYWKSVGGTLTWKATVTAPPCSGQGGGTVQIPNVDGDHAATLQITTEGGRLRHSGQNGPWPGTSPYYTVNCPDYSYLMPLLGGFGFFQTDAVKDELAPDGKSFSGEHVTGSPAAGGMTQHIYSFRCRHGC